MSMAIPLDQITPERLVLDQLVHTVSDALAPAETATVGPGAVTSFLGLVRDQNLGRRVLWLEYEAYAPLALAVFQRIREEVRGQWPTVHLGIHHRTGRLEVGEASVAIAAASPHRTETFAACRYAIERVKQVAPIWKREVFEGGSVWIEGATADPSDAAARQEAFRRACV